jgi:hypothetical protein
MSSRNTSESVDLSKLDDETRAKVKRLIEPMQAFYIEAPRKSVERWKKEAKKSGQKIKDWAAIALDDAADGMPKLLREARDLIVDELNANGLEEVTQNPMLRRRQKLCDRIDLLLKGGK